MARPTKARFIGTEDDFIDLFGSTLLTKAVTRYTRTLRRKANGVCENCGRSGLELQAAHKAGMDRITLARRVLSTFPKNANGEIEVDMLEFLRRFYEIHQPLKDNFLYLCEECHKKYDGKIAKRPMGSNPFGSYGCP